MPSYLYPGPPSGARSFLSSITQAMISFTGLVFSITIVALQLTSGQLSSRVLRTFLRDRLIQFSLGVFVATFVYAMVVQRAVRGSVGHGAFVPRAAVTVAFLFVLASVGLFIAYIAHMANMLRVATIVTTIGDESKALMTQRYPPDQPPGEPPAALGAVGRTVAAPHGGVLVSVNEKALAARADRARVVVAVVPRVGDYVATGAPLLTVHPDDNSTGDAKGALDEAELVGEVAFDSERTMEQDLAFGFRQLVDIAQRALSPGINDPTTATQALDVLHDLLRQLATRHLPTGRFFGADGGERLVIPQYRFDDFVDLAVGEIWHYGSGAAQIPEKIARLLSDIDQAALPEHRPAVARWLRRIREAARPPAAGPRP